jgi:hypothetical protein
MATSPASTHPTKARLRMLSLGILAIGVLMAVEGSRIVRGDRALVHLLGSP